MEGGTDRLRQSTAPHEHCQNPIFLPDRARHRSEFASAASAAAMLRRWTRVKPPRCHLLARTPGVAHARSARVHSRRKAAASRGGGCDYSQDRVLRVLLGSVAAVDSRLPRIDCSRDVHHESRCSTRAMRRPSPSLNVPYRIRLFGRAHRRRTSANGYRREPASAGDAPGIDPTQRAGQRPHASARLESLEIVYR